ncbi:MAG: RraA family protein [Acidobacteriia bacterium]|nr:RraA family protein [Terriglobia bacterium]
MTLINRCRAIATSTWSDALDRLKLDGVIGGLALRSGSGAMCGRAVTVKESVGDFYSNAFAPGDFLEAVQSESVLMIAAAGAAVSTFGGLAALAAVKRGASGVVIDGACRDVAEIRASGLWLASRHATPMSGKGRIRVDAIGVPVELCGATVAAGDYIIGDETGVVCVSAARIEEALAIAEDLAARDAAFAEELRRGETFRAIASKLGHV